MPSSGRAPDGPGQENHEDPTPRDPKQTVLLAETACRLTDRRHPGMLERLSAAYAAAGQHQDAVDTLKRAIPLADAAANEPMAKRLRDRLQELQGRKSDDATE